MAKSKTKPAQPAFADGSYFKDIPLFGFDENTGTFLVDEPGDA